MNQVQKEAWRCHACGRQLGVLHEDGRLELRLAKKHRYRVALPATCVCPNPQCGTLNELPAR
jgi:hypothetical protein